MYFWTSDTHKNTSETHFGYEKYIRLKMLIIVKVLQC